MIYMYTKYRGVIMIAVRLDKETQERLARLASITGRTKTYYVREAIEKHLEDLEMIYIAEQRISNLKSGKSTTISWEDVKKENGLQD